MSPDSDPRQLDLTAAITEVPQANNIALFIRLMEAARSEERSLEGLAEVLDVEVRTVRYYLDFGRWLGWISSIDASTFTLTDEGRAFSESVSARGRLFANALFARPLIQTINELKRQDFADLPEPEATRAAAVYAIERMTQLSQATVERRAQALSSMLRWAYRPRQLDWTTGQPIESNAPYDFPGQGFLTAFNARKFGGSRAFYIGFPHQVTLFARGEPLKQSDWARASYETPDRAGRWFGSIPINPSTLATARRGGPDLRQLLITCNPYIALIVVLLSPPAPAHPAPLRLTRDMYGLRLWHHEFELGLPLQTLGKLAKAIDLTPFDFFPRVHRRHIHDEARHGTDQEFVETLLHCRIVQPSQTSLVLSTDLINQLIRQTAQGPPLKERLNPLQTALLEVLRGFSFP